MPTHNSTQTPNPPLRSSNMPRHTPMPRASHPPQLRQQSQRTKLPQHLFEQVLRRGSRLQRRRPHQTTRAPHAIRSRARARRRRTCTTRVCARAARTRAVTSGGEGRGGCAGTTDSTNPEDVDADDDGALFWIWDGVADGVASCECFAALYEEAGDEGWAELVGGVGVVETVCKDDAPGFVGDVD